MTLCAKTVKLRVKLKNILSSTDTTFSLSGIAVNVKLYLYSLSQIPMI